MKALVADHVTKTYRIGVGRARGREMMPPPFDKAASRLFPNWWRRNTFNALEDINFSIEAGSAVGLLGHNGAGKTTMLKVIAAVTAPTSGNVTVNGRLAALIDVLVGFHPDLTGRENTYLLGAIYGFNRKAMNERVDRILEFAEITDLADTPLKRYSSGMMARLGFSIIASLDVDILLVDEILAVGDASFQRKCVEWLDDYRKSGGTLLFISHNLGLVRSMTQRVIWLDHGRVVEEGPTDEVLARYGRAMEKRDEVLAGSRRKAHQAMVDRGMNRWGAGGARIEEVHVEDIDKADDPVEIVITYEAASVDEAVFCVGFIDEAGNEVGASASPTLGLEGAGTVRCAIDPFPLRSGIYFPVVAILSPDGVVQDQWRLERAVVVERNGSRRFTEDFGPVDIAGSWSDLSVARGVAG